MTRVTTNNGVQISYKDWALKFAEPIVFHHGWPPSSDSRENQKLFGGAS